jgi:hypothetical protein
MPGASVAAGEECRSAARAWLGADVEPDGVSRGPTTGDGGVLWSDNEPSKESPTEGMRKQLGRVARVSAAKRQVVAVVVAVGQ